MLQHNLDTNTSMLLTLLVFIKLKLNFSAEEMRCVFDVIISPKNRRFLIGPNPTFFKSIKVMYIVFQVIYTSFRRVTHACFCHKFMTSWLRQTAIVDVMMTF